MRVRIELYALFGCSYSPGGVPVHPPFFPVQMFAFVLNTSRWPRGVIGVGRLRRH